MKQALLTLLAGLSQVSCGSVMSIEDGVEVYTHSSGEVFPISMLNDYDFSLISYYKSNDRRSREIDSLIDGAKAKFDQMVENGSS